MKTILAMLIAMLPIIALAQNEVPDTIKTQELNQVDNPQLLLSVGGNAAVQTAEGQDVDVFNEFFLANSGQLNLYSKIMMVIAHAIGIFEDILCRTICIMMIVCSELG